jgi:hypothetical protein
MISLATPSVKFLTLTGNALPTETCVYVCVCVCIYIYIYIHICRLLLPTSDPVSYDNYLLTENVTTQQMEY